LALQNIWQKNDAITQLNKKSKSKILICKKFQIFCVKKNFLCEKFFVCAKNKVVAATPNQLQTSTKTLNKYFYFGTTMCDAKRFVPCVVIMLCYRVGKKFYV